MTAGPRHFADLQPGDRFTVAGASYQCTARPERVHGCLYSAGVASPDGTTAFRLLRWQMDVVQVAPPPAPDPAINQATGQPCKGKAAALALVALLADPHLRAWMVGNGRAAQLATADAAAAPFTRGHDHG